MARRTRSGATSTSRICHDPHVAYDEVLADRIRELLTGEPALTEKRMFGGLTFLIGGNMAVSASGQGGILVRVDPADSLEFPGGADARPMEMRGRVLDGWLRVDAEHVQAPERLEAWVQRGAKFAGSLPAKP